MRRLSGDVAAGAAQSWINFKPKNSPQAITSKNAFSASASWILEGEGGWKFSCAASSGVLAENNRAVSRAAGVGGIPAAVTAQDTVNGLLI